MSLKRLVAGAVSRVRPPLERFVAWLRAAIAAPPLEDWERRRREDDDCVFQPRDF